MKNLIIVFVAIFIYAISSSCEKMYGDFLDKAPGTDVTIDTIFSTKLDAEKSLASCYEYCSYSWNMIPNGSNSDVSFTYMDPMGGFTDEAQCEAPWMGGNMTFNIGNVGSTSEQTDRLWNKRWMGIRKVSIFLENIDRVKGLDPAYVTRLKAEAKFLRALAYEEMFRWYGGVPVVDHSFTLTENWYIPRATLKQTVDFMLADLEVAIADLPTAAWPSAEVGHATKLAALAAKSRILLYAASPLYNTGTPYLDLPEHNDLICMGDYQISRWQAAADAAKAVLDNAAAFGVSLVTNQGVTKNYKYVWEIPDNTEMIFADQLANGNRFGYYNFPQPMGGMNGFSITFNFQKYYEKKDGTPQTWNMLGGSDLLQKYSELDPRFYQCVVTQGRDWNTAFPKLQLTTTPVGRESIGCTGGAWWHKPVPDAIVNNVMGTSIVSKYQIFRLAEFYLNYAEALNEANASPPQEAYDAVFAVRNRSGMPAFPAGLTKDQFRTKLQNEITIEFAMEEMRLFNLRRWLLANIDGVMKGNMYGIKIHAIAGNPNEFRYVPYVFEIRTFTPKMYLNPFMQTEVDKGYIIQNPGY